MFDGAIKSIEVVNFMSHVNSKVDNLQSLVAIVGPNGSGKTAFMEAAVLTLFGLSWEEKDLRDDESSGSITITFYNGTQVRRERTKSTQKTFITYPGKEPIKLTGVRDISEDVYKATGFKRLRFTKDGKPISFQYEPLSETEPFLVGSNTSSGLLKAITSFSIGSDLPRIRQVLNSQYSKAKSDLESHRVKIQTATEEIESLRGDVWAKLLDRYRKTRKLEKQLAATKKSISLLTELQVAVAVLDEFKAVKVHELPDIADDIDELKATKSRLEKVAQLLTLIEELKNRHALLKGSVAKLEEEAAKATITKCSTCKKHCIGVRS